MSLWTCLFIWLAQRCRERCCVSLGGNGLRRRLAGQDATEARIPGR